MSCNGDLWNDRLAKERDFAGVEGDWAVKGGTHLDYWRRVGEEKLVPLSGSTSPIFEKDSETRRRAVAIGEAI